MSAEPTQRFQWCCTACGESCDVQRIEFEYEVTEAANKATLPRLVSACCSKALFMWDNELEQDIDVHLGCNEPDSATR